MVAGDFNLPDVAWTSFKPIVHSESLLHRTIQEVTAPTRVCSTSANVLDLFFCNDQTLASSVLTVPGISDHDVVLVKMCFAVAQRRASVPRKVFLYENGDYASISRQLLSYFSEFQELCLCSDVNGLWNALKTKLLSLTQTFVPSRLISAKHRNDKPWLHKEL